MCSCPPPTANSQTRDDCGTTPPPSLGCVCVRGGGEGEGWLVRTLEEQLVHVYIEVCFMGLKLVGIYSDSTMQGLHSALPSSASVRPPTHAPTHPHMHAHNEQFHEAY